MVTMTRTTLSPGIPSVDTAPDDVTRVAVSTVIFTLRRDPLDDHAAVVLPLVRRTRDPHEGLWALPGGWLDTTREPRRRGIPHARRDDRHRTELPRAAVRVRRRRPLPRPRRVDRLLGARPTRRDPRPIDVENVSWFDAAQLPRLAFDHNEIVDYALWRLRNKVGYSRIAHGLLADEFTLAELREVYESILGRRLDPANFRRQVENSGNLIPTDRFRTGSHRPARLYRYNQDVELADRGPLVVRH